MQTPDAWPNLFRQARILSAVDLVHADRMRRKVAREMARGAPCVRFREGAERRVTFWNVLTRRANP